MKKLIMMGFVLVFLALMPTTTKADVYEFIAGQHEDVGDIIVTNTGSDLIVRYETISGWWALQETHLAVSEVLADIPQKNGNPIPGAFPYAVPTSSDTTWAEYVIPLVADDILSSNGKKVLVPGHNWAVDDVLYLGVHGVVGVCDCEDLNYVLPDEVDAEIIYPGADSYFVVTITGDGILDGVHRGWCADADDYIEGDETHLGQIYSTICEDIEDIPEDAIVYDSNLPSVNWLLNNWETLNGYTAGDAQAAIWILLSGHLPDDTSSIEYHEGDPWPEDQAFDETRALELVAAAEANDDFMPVCGEVMAVVFIPPIWDTGAQSGEPRQTVLIEVPAPCCETAWGAMPGGPPWGLDFPGKNWALYITYTVAEVAP